MFQQVFWIYMCIQNKRLRNETIEKNSPKSVLQNEKSSKKIGKKNHREEKKKRIVLKTIQSQRLYSYNNQKLFLF
jgi:hypothetical protein